RKTTSGDDRTRSLPSAATSHAQKRRGSSTRSRSRAGRRCSNTPRCRRWAPERTTMSDQPPRSRAERIFERLLRLFPADFRGDYGEDMAATFRDQRHDARARGGAAGTARLWWDPLTGIFATAPRQPVNLLAGGVRYALRGLRRNPAFTLVAVLALAVGIGANTAVFTIVNGVLMRALPYRNPGELVAIYEKAQGGP